MTFMTITDMPMPAIKLLYIKNIITRQQGQLHQQLTFFMMVNNLGYDKHVDVVWAGEDGVWQTLTAWHHSALSPQQEYWQATLNLALTQQQSLPGNIQCSLRYRVANNEYWDNNDGQNYRSEADSGVRLTHHKQAHAIDFDPNLNDDQGSIPIHFAVDNALNIDKVTIHWTIDNWQTEHRNRCRYQRNYWDKMAQSHARNPNQYGVQLWKGKIRSDNLSKLQYAICYQNEQQTFWENNGGQNFSFHHKQFKVLILNLHCYQEDNQDQKFTQIANAIDSLDVDIVCLQEVAELWKDGKGDWPSNSAKIINDRLDHRYHLYTDWSHLGFDKYREGVAILSKYPLVHPESRYVSDSDDIYDIHSRKVVKAQIQIPHIGAINVFCVHLSWIEDGFKQQFERLHEWAKNRDTDDVKATLLCGDFNITAGTSGYELVVKSNEYQDQFLAANQHDVFDKVFKVNDPHWQDLLADDYRIDYIFMNKDSALNTIAAQTLFTEHDYGRVSDHCGYMMTFEAK